MDIDALNKHIDLARSLIKKNEHEWKPRYAKYSSVITKNIDKIKYLKQYFNEWEPLYIYMNVTNAAGAANTFNLRYNGQQVADIKFKRDGVVLDISSYQKNTNEHFNIEYQKSSEFPWRSEEAAQFRKSFPKTTVFGKTPEHALESKLLSELEKNSKVIKDEQLHHIQPVKIANICRFQMPTPLSASDKTELIYQGWRGGAIDILARVGAGRGTSLCIMELKKDAQAIGPVISQALAYAIFIQELLACDSGREWFSIFGFSPNKSLNNPTLKVCSVMPLSEAVQQSFHEKINIDTDLGALKIRYMYLDGNWENSMKVRSTNIFQ